MFHVDELFDLNTTKTNKQQIGRRQTQKNKINSISKINLIRYPLYVF